MCMPTCDAKNEDSGDKWKWKWKVTPRINAVGMKNTLEL